MTANQLELNVCAYKHELRGSQKMQTLFVTLP